MEQIVNWPGWEFVRKLGSGSYGAVYEIRKQIGSYTRRAALKVIPIPRDEDELAELYQQYDEATADRSLQEQVDDVVQEFSVMIKLRGNRNIVTCEDIQCVDRPNAKGKIICLQMELLQPLSETLKAGEEAQQAIRMGTDLLSALAVCREKKIIHRDIKPKNIFVSEAGDYKLGDFGVARSMDRTGSPTMNIGTLNYMAPEVRNGEYYDSSSDLYSLGLVLYWVLNEKHLPFVPILDRPPKWSENEEAAERRFRGEAFPLPKHGGETLGRLVCSMCAFNPADRPDIQTLQEEFLKLAQSSLKPTTDVPVYNPIGDPDSEDEDQTINVGVFNKGGRFNKSETPVHKSDEEKTAQTDVQNPPPPIESPINLELEESKKRKKRRRIIAGIAAFLVLIAVVLAAAMPELGVQCILNGHSFSNSTHACSRCGKSMRSHTVTYDGYDHSYGSFEEIDKALLYSTIFTSPVKNCAQIYLPKGESEVTVYLHEIDGTWISVGTTNIRTEQNILLSFRGKTYDFDGVALKNTKWNDSPSENIRLVFYTIH